jgi:integrase
MDSLPLLDCAGRLRSPATTSSFHPGRPPRNKGRRYPADPPTVAEIIAVMRAAGERPDGVRLRGVVVVLWRAGLRISEALALAETDLDRDRGSILVRRGKGGKRREVGMDRWGWESLEPWLELRAGLPAGLLFCVLRGPTRGRPCTAAGIRSQLRSAAGAVGVRRRAVRPFTRRSSLGAQHRPPQRRPPIARVVGKRAARRHRSPALTGAGPDRGSARSAVTTPAARRGQGATAEAVVLSYGL